VHSIMGIASQGVPLTPNSEVCSAGWGVAMAGTHDGFAPATPLPSFSSGSVPNPSVALHRLYLTADRGRVDGREAGQE